MVKMSLAQVETFRIEAVRFVLGTLGEELFSVLKDILLRDYKIVLDDDALFALEELQIALQRVLGESPADLIMREIYFQIQELVKERLR